MHAIYKTVLRRFAVGTKGFCNGARSDLRLKRPDRRAKQRSSFQKDYKIINY